MLQHIEESTRQHHRGIIEPIWGDIEKLGGTGLRDHSMDTVILANTLFQIEDKEGLVAEIKRIIKPGGKILIVDWSGSFGGLGPAPDAVVSERDAEKLFTDASFHKLETFRGGPHHYALLYNASAP
jgi:ubiquinone/menaquinone biosynthesis C-methylase UbiE